MIFTTVKEFTDYLLEHAIRGDQGVLIAGEPIDLTQIQHVPGGNIELHPIAKTVTEDEDAAYREGHTDGQSEGFDDGHSEGYDEGFADGEASKE